MLILTRRIGEKLMIGEDVEVVVLDVVGRQVRLGVRAPANVSVDREEVRARKDHDAQREQLRFQG